MADLDLATLTAPLDDEDPCGPDLEAEDDGPYANFIAAAEMALPSQYFVEDFEGKRRPFFTEDRYKDLDLKGYVTTAGTLLGRSRDLRVLCLMAKLQIFDRRLKDFTASVEAVAVLLETRWESVHPSVESGLRTAVLERLGEQYTVVTALNNAPLFRSKRFASVTWQSYMTAVRAAGGGRADAPTASTDHILIEECKLDPDPVAAAQSMIGRLGGALARIESACAQAAGSSAPDLVAIRGALVDIGAMLDRVNPSADAVPAGEDAAGTPDPVAGRDAQPRAAPSPFETTAHAVRALEAATRYFARTEPSSPALLLLRQARALVGKTFFEALELLLPDQARKATLSVAPAPVFNLSLRQLAERGIAAEANPAPAPAVEDPIPPADSRSEAMALLERISIHYRICEPSSAIPLLLDQARATAGKDFMSLIRTMMSEAALRGS